MVFLTLALPSAVLAVKAPDSKKGMTFEIEKVFEVDFSTDAQGGCKSYKELLTNSYYDAIVALTGALNAIESVSQVTKKSKDHDPIAKKEWLRVRQTYEKVFGVDPWTPAGGLTKDVSPIRKTYDEYLASLQTPEKDSEKEPPKFTLRCEDDWLEWLEPTDPDPREAGKPDAKKFTLEKPREGQKAFPKGAFQGTNLEPSRSLMIRKEWVTLKNKKKPICGHDYAGLGPTGAMVDPPTGLIVFCKTPLVNKGVVATLSDLTSQIKVGAAIDLARFAGNPIWLHEFGHLLKNLRDQRALDKDGIKIKHPLGGYENVYHWEMTVNLAKCRVDDVPENPECYRMFAVAMYWNEWFWATGKAKKEPEAEGGMAGPSRMKRGSRMLRDLVEPGVIEH